MDHTYRDIWLCLNQANLKPIPQHLTQYESKLTFAAVLQSFRNNAGAKIINLRTLGKADETYLVRQAISLEYLLRNLQKTITGRHLDARDFQLTAVKNRAVYAFCPFTGRLVESNHSLLANIHVVFYRFRSEQVFYVATAGIGHGFKKSALYFPERELIVTAGDSWSFEEDDLIELKTRVVCNFKRCHQYLSDHNRAGRKTAVWLGFYHFAHHLWNELSGVHRLHRKKLLSRVDKFLLLREPLGHIEQLFPEIPTDKIERKDTIGAIFDEILANNYFVVRVGDDFIPRDLATRVYRVAQRNCLRETLDYARKARRKHSPLLWVGIRVGSRTWTNQVDGLSKVINCLHTQFPRLGVVFDGFSVPADRPGASSDHQVYAEILNQENAVVNDVVEKLQHHPQGTPGIFNIIGSSIFDANVWAHAIDVYVSPYGTLQHKVAWLANKPGIIHTNQTLLENPSQYIWAAIANAIPPRYVRRASVEDVRNIQVEAVLYRKLTDARTGVQAEAKSVQGDPEFNNYELHWRALYDDLLDLLKSPKITLKLALSVLLHRSKRKLKKALQSLTSRLDPSKI
jgi:hypothetical protein